MTAVVTETIVKGTKQSLIAQAENASAGVKSEFAFAKANAN